MKRKNNDMADHQKGMECAIGKERIGQVLVMFFASHRGILLSRRSSI